LTVAFTTGLEAGLETGFDAGLTAGFGVAFGVDFATGFAVALAAVAEDFVDLAGLAPAMDLVVLTVGFVGIYDIYGSFIWVWQNISSKK